MAKITHLSKSKVSKSYEPHDKKVQTSKKVHPEALSPLVKQTLCSKQTDLLFRANRAFIQSKQRFRLKNILLIINRYFIWASIKSPPMVKP